MGILGDLLDDIVSIPEKVAELAVETVTAPLTAAEILEKKLSELFDED